MADLSKWQKMLGRILQWEYNTTQLIAFLAPAPVFLVVGAVLSYYLPVLSFAVAILYIFIIFPSVVLTRSSSTAWPVPRAVLHSSVLCWAIAGFLPVESYVHQVLG